MNTSHPSQNFEPAWLTYSRAMAFMMPAAFFWIFSTVFLLPKIRELCQAAGVTVFDLGQAPVVFRAGATVGQILIVLTEHGLLISGAAILGVALLEWRCRPWPRFRRAAMNTGVFLLNALVLMAITMMIVSILMAAPALLRHAH